MTADAYAPVRVGWPHWRLAGLGAGLTLLTAAGPALHLTYGGWVLMLIFIAGGACAFAASRSVAHSDQRGALLVILVAAAAMRIVLLFGEPYLSTDIYRYVWDGRVQAAGINPYRHVPAAPELGPLRDASIFPNINRADYAVTIYPPVAQAAFLAITRFGESVVVMKLGLLAFEGATIAVLIALLQRLGHPVTRIAAYAWHPLAIWEVAGSGHVDIVMCALLFAGLLLFLGGRTLLAGVAVTFGALAKPVAVLALPVLWRPWNWRLPLVVAATVLLAYLPYLSVGSGVLGFLGGYIDEEGLASGNGIALLRLIALVTGPIPHAAALYAATSATLLIGLAFSAAFRSDRSDRAALSWLSWLLIVFLFLSSPHYPWYFLVLVPLVALSPSVTAWTLTLCSPLLYDSIGGAGWPGYDTRIALFTLATAAALVLDARSGIRNSSMGETR
jgi:alpha-1,6-mannosyltransferase